MKKLTLSMLVIFLFGCVDASRNANTFNLDGEITTLSDETLIELREYWKGNMIIRTSSLLKKEDIIWSLDFIALMESMNKTNCKSLQIIQVRNFDPHSDIDNINPQLQAGAFDYVWQVRACDTDKYFRLINPKQSLSFVLHQINFTQKTSEVAQ